MLPAVQYANRVAEKLAIRNLVDRLSADNASLFRELVVVQQRLHAVEEKLARLDEINKFLLSKFDNMNEVNEEINKHHNKNEEMKRHQLQKERRRKEDEEKQKEMMLMMSQSPPSDCLVKEENDDSDCDLEDTLTLEGILELENIMALEDTEGEVKL